MDKQVHTCSTWLCQITNKKNSCKNPKIRTKIKEGKRGEKKKKDEQRHAYQILETTAKKKKTKKS
jgi:hypothetical protein